MRWVLAVCIVFCLLASNSGAFDSAGKFGMGIRLWGTPIITFSNMTIGVSDLIGLEPSMGYFEWKTETDISEQSSNILILSIISNIKPIRAARSNLVIKLGGLFGKTSSSYSTAWGESGTSYASFALLTGVGIEHFVNDNFSVNVGALSGLWTGSPEDSNDSASFTIFGNQLVDFSLICYLK